MKKVKGFSTFIFIFGLFALISCSKNENAGPSEAKKLTLKDIPELIDSQQGYSLLDQFPSFPAGDSSIMEYLKSTITYPQSAIDNNIHGKVFVSFIVEKTGSVSNIEIVKGIGYGCDEQVVHAIENMPSWTPGIIQGQNVNVKMILPIEFKQIKTF
jgi:TonB family protein